MSGFVRSATVVGNGLAAWLQELLADAPALRLTRAFSDAAEALAQLATLQADLLLLSDELPHACCLQLLADIRHHPRRLPVVVLTQTPDVRRAVEFVRAGAADYLAMPDDSVTLAAALEKVLADHAALPKPTAAEVSHSVGIVGESPAMKRAMDLIARVGKSHCNPVLICGETGTGKELAARAVHMWRHGSGRKFVAVNCAALTANLLESELFGHVKGAFTGADRDKTGLFELAQDGSIFLDEISEMAPELQAKLLRVLQEHSFRKVGGTADITCNATVIASSNRRLLNEVATGKFRCDLYYRLAVFPLTLPPLRDPTRRQDIPLLAGYFASIAAGGDEVEFAPQAIQRLMQHRWPGNVRELRNVIERAMLLENSGKITAESILFDDQELSLQAPAAVPSPVAPAANAQEDFSLEAAEREFIIRALKEANWQRTRAAGLLGITRATLHAKLKRYDIKAPSSRSVEPAEEPQVPAAVTHAGV